MIALLVGLAFADDGEDAASQASFGAALGPINDLPVIAVPVLDGVVYGTDYPAPVYVGAKALGLEPAFVASLRDGLELLYERDYAGTRAHFQRLETAAPGRALDAFADVLVYQAMMLENYDYRFEKQWEGASRRSRATLEVAIAAPGPHPLEQFLFVGVSGIESMHAMRKESYFAGLRLAFEAMDHAQAVADEAPGFPDLLLANGIYDYWRTVITESSSVLPHFGDHRAAGIAAMKVVEEQGVFMSAPATLSLVFAWVEEHRTAEALAACEKNRARYPHNVINNLTTGRTYVSSRKYDTALAIFDDVLATDPTNQFVHYYIGVAQMRAGKLVEADASLNQYLAYPNLETWQTSNTFYRLGQLRYKQQKYDEAELLWQRAVKVDGNSQAKLRLEKLRTSRKDGTLP